jgi:TonB family protein
MTLWIAWSMLITAVVAVGAAAADRVATFFGLARRFVWLGAIAAATVAPVVLASRPIASGLAPSAVATGSPSVSLGSDGASRASASTRARMDASTVARHVDPWAARAWLVASLICFGVLLHAVMRLRQHRREWEDVATDGHRVLVARDAGPAVVGVLRPRIVVPRWALDADRATWDLMLRHETEHIRAGDSRALFAVAVVLALFPWNAALWWMARRLRLATEIDCDARVIRAVGGARAYGMMLLAVGERHAMPLPISASLSERGTNLEARIDAMTTPRACRPFAASLPFVTIGLTALATIGWTPRPAPFIRSETQPGVSTPVDPKPLRGNVGPRYPDRLRRASVAGHVIVRLAIDTGGVPDTAKIEMLEVTHDEFGIAVRNAVARWRFDSGGSTRLTFCFRIVDTSDAELGRASPMCTAHGMEPGTVVTTATAVPRPPGARGTEPPPLLPGALRRLTR